MSFVKMWQGQALHVLLSSPGPEAFRMTEISAGRSSHTFAAIEGGATPQPPGATLHEKQKNAGYNQGEKINAPFSRFCAAATRTEPWHNSKCRSREDTRIMSSEGGDIHRVVATRPGLNWLQWPPSLGGKEQHWVPFHEPYRRTVFFF